MSNKISSGNSFFWTEGNGPWYKKIGFDSIRLWLHTKLFALLTIRTTEPVQEML